MMIRVILEPEAEQDITDAYDWYEEQLGLGERPPASVAESALPTSPSVPSPRATH